MVAAAVLVLDRDDDPPGRVSSKDIQRVPADRVLGAAQLQRQPEHHAESVKILGQPRGEVIGLVRPSRLYRNRFQLPKLHQPRSQRCPWTSPAKCREDRVRPTSMA